MAAGTLPETHDPSGIAVGDPELQVLQPDNDLPRPSRNRWWKHGLLLAGIVAMLIAAAGVFSGSRASRDTTRRLTHTIQRGDLLVTVTEQGTVESADNTEIKCRVRGRNTVTFVVKSGTQVKKGQVLVDLDTLFMEEQVAERTKYALWSRSGAERSEANVARARLAVDEYRKGRFVAELMGLRKDLAIAKSSLRTAENVLRHTQMMAESGYVSDLELEAKTFAVARAKLDVGGKETDIEVLKEFTKKEELATLQGNLDAVEATHKANVERAEADDSRRLRAVEERAYCTVRADKDGMVIYPSAAAWKNAPDIEEGATVHKDQVLLLMPDLTKMQVKVGIHESVVDRIKSKMFARVTLPDRSLDGEVASVASVAQPSGWWTGGVVKYDTIIKLPSVPGLKPGMSAEVEVLIARYDNVLSVPVAAVIETDEGHLCWVETADGSKRRKLSLGDSNDAFIVVEAGLKEGEQVVLNPLAYVDEAQTEVLKPSDKTKRAGKAKPPAPNPIKPPNKAGSATSCPQVDP